MNYVVVIIAIESQVVTNLFGGRTDKNKMVDIVRCLPSEEVCATYGLDPKNVSVYADFTWVDASLF